MEKTKYESIKSQTPSSLRMMLVDHLKRYLEEDRAVALVGAGFSRNALMNETSCMKDWNMLGLDFYQKLYGHAPDPEKDMFLSPIRLASEVEASFGRFELDNLILQSLPDDVVMPSSLHEQLVSLKWRDIFTTNYDTLLEKAYLLTERPYAVVTNKDTLLYSKQPRIVKLHGSFPNIHPFIITEEDFRTYPEKYPEFVNTVRQALIENLFCLIGFSGDDPNFKSWLGWLRDVMGKQIAPVYMITFDRNLHNAKRKMCTAQNIDILNLADLPGVLNIQEAFEFLFAYLKEPDVIKWTGAIEQKLGKLKSEEDIVSITKEMAEVRRTYPGWLTLPKDYYDNFSDIDHDIINFDISQIEHLDVNNKIGFLYEINWRQTISQSPIGLEWFIKEITELSFSSKDYKDDTKQKVIELKLSLLTFYRRRGYYLHYDALIVELDNVRQNMQLTQLRKFTYDRCIKASSLLDYDMLSILLNEWQVAPTDYVGAIWKSSMLYETGRISEAASLVNMAMQHLNISILSSHNGDDYLRSCKTVMHKQQRIYSWAAGRDSDQPFNPYKTVEYFKSQLLKPRPKDGTSFMHRFNVGHTDRSYHFGSSRFLENYLFSYRYFALCESCGFPFGMHGMTIDKENNTFFLSYLLPDAFQYGIAIMVRSCTYEYVKECVSREVLSGLSAKQADDIYTIYFEKTRALTHTTNTAFKERLLNVIIPLLVRLCVKVSVDHIKSLVPILFEVHQLYPVSFKKSDFNTIYNNLPLTDRLEVQVQALEQPIVLDGHHNYDIPQKYDHLDSLMVSEKVLQIIKEGLYNTDPAIQRLAYYRAILVLHSNISVDDKGTLQWALFNWRNQTKAMDLLRDSYQTVKESPVHIKFAERLKNEDLSSLSLLNVNDIKSSEVLGNITCLLNNLTFFHDYLTASDHQTVIEKFCTIVTENEKLLSKDDSQELFGGFHSYMSKVICSMEGYLYHADLSGVSGDVMTRLSDVVSQLKQWNFRYLSMQVLLIPYDKRLREADIKKELEENISKTETHMDVVQALVFLSKRTSNFQVVLRSIISFCKYSSKQIVYDWLTYLKFFTWQGLLSETAKQELLKMLKHIYYNVESDTEDVDLLNDIYVSACKLAGAAALLWGESEETKLWKEIAMNKNVFNEVRYAYEYGYSKDIPS